MARIFGASVLTALLIAACGAVAGTPGSSPGGTPSSVPSPTARATPPPTAGPTPTATCAPGPLTPAEFLAADPGCYLTVDVSVVGWWDMRRTDDRGGGQLDHMLRASMPFGQSSESPEDFLLVDEIDAVPATGWPDGAHWATVTGRRSATNDRACHVDTDAEMVPTRHCPSYLVATSVVESVPPAAALAECAGVANEEGDPWVDVEDFTAYPPACFGSSDMTVRGWFDIRYLITGWEAPWGIAPGWLWLPIGPWKVVAPSSDPTTSSSLLVYVDPARGLDVSRTNRWVLLTGHYADAKARTCHIEYAGGYDPAVYGERIPDSFARRQCEAHFVVTSIEDTSP